MKTVQSRTGLRSSLIPYRKPAASGEVLRAGVRRHKTFWDAPIVFRLVKRNGSGLSSCGEGKRHQARWVRGRFRRGLRPLGLTGGKITRLIECKEHHPLCLPRRHFRFLTSGTAPAGHGPGNLWGIHAGHPM